MTADERVKLAIFHCTHDISVCNDCFAAAIRAAEADAAERERKRIAKLSCAGCYLDEPLEKTPLGDWRHLRPDGEIGYHCEAFRIWNLQEEEPECAPT
jgi:hypothetical protein